MFDNFKDSVGWIIFILSNISALVVSIFTWIKSKKMMPREERGADLDNLSKELEITQYYETLATRAAEKTVQMQERLDKLEKDYDQLEKVIKEQIDIIKKQTLRIDQQDLKIREQEKEIEILKCELHNERAYNSALIQQMKDQKVIPLERSGASLKNCDQIKNR